MALREYCRISVWDVSSGVRVEYQKLRQEKGERAEY